MSSSAYCGSWWTYVARWMRTTPGWSPSCTSCTSCTRECRRLPEGAAGGGGGTAETPGPVAGAFLCALEDGRRPVRETHQRLSSSRERDHPGPLARDAAGPGWLLEDTQQGPQCPPGGREVLRGGHWPCPGLRESPGWVRVGQLSLRPVKAGARGRCPRPIRGPHPTVEPRAVSGQEPG